MILGLPRVNKQKNRTNEKLSVNSGSALPTNVGTQNVSQNVATVPKQEKAQINLLKQTVLHQVIVKMAQ